MIILSIETSCDDTSIAVLQISGVKKPCFTVLANIISSQVEVHSKWGGIVPMLAKREHQKTLTPVLTQALKESGMLKKNLPGILNIQSKIKPGPQKRGPQFENLKKILEREKVLAGKLQRFLTKYQKPDIDIIAVTTGPGLEPCLWAGINFAKSLSYFWDIPIAPVNHIEAHILANWLDKDDIAFPALCLIVSGGHTQLILAKSFGEYKIIGETRDDAAGECFDKIARILGLPYPGGPMVAAEAAKFNDSKLKTGKSQVTLPRPMIYSKNYDFSFSGLKTAVLYDFKKRPVKIQKSKSYIRQICAEAQQAIIDVLIRKTIKAAREYSPQTILMGGGVASNKELRKQLEIKIKNELPSLKYLTPNLEHCVDNALMVAIAGYYKQLENKTVDWKKIKAEANLRIN